MNEQENFEFKPFKQIPEWRSNQKFEITSNELFAITKIIESYAILVPAFESLLARLIDNKQIKVRYEDMQGNEMQEQEVSEMMKKVMENVVHSDNAPCTYSSGSIEPEI